MEPPQQNSWAELIRFAIIAILIIVPIRLFIAQPFIVSGASMDPTFKNSDYLIVDELSYYLRSPNRGEVVVFRYPIDPKKYFIKRVVGLPGETVIIKNSTVSVANQAGEVLVIDEPYITNQTIPNLTTTLSANQYFVMGDNREASFDSRRFGAVNEDLIRGRALIRVLPLSNLGILPGYFNN